MRYWTYLFIHSSLPTLLWFDMLSILVELPESKSFLLEILLNSHPRLALCQNSDLSTNIHMDSYEFNLWRNRELCSEL